MVDKPPRLPTSGRHLDDPDCLQFWLMQRARRMVWAVHQLDADTSGVNVFVWRKPLVPEWQKRLRWPNAQKTYLAIVQGVPTWDAYRESGAIGFVERDGWRGYAVVPDGKPAATRFRVLARGDGVAALACTLESGRTHQIRVHLQHLGCSLLGEEWYRATPCQRHPRQALHAAEVRVGTERFTAPVPDDLRQLAASLGLPLESALIDGSAS